MLVLVQVLPQETRVVGILVVSVVGLVPAVGNIEPGLGLALPQTLQSVQHVIVVQDVDRGHN